MRILVVGAGFAGAVTARELAEAGHQVFVIDERYHVAGNAYDFIDDSGIRVHKYGPHLFHTNNKRVFDYLSRFTEWLPYEHRVEALLEDGRYAVLPPNRRTCEMVGGKENVVDVFFRPYTKKMWGMELEELNPDIINRVPVREDDNVLYFPDDEYQYVPKDGYTRMFENILDHENISVSLDTRFDTRMQADYDHTFNSMPIDVYYGFMYGELPYRSVRFDTVTLDSPHMLPVATVNFTHSGPKTRVTEWKNIPGHGVNDTRTTLTFEEPCDYRENFMKRYYPVKDADGKNRDTYSKYRKLADADESITFIGRCGMYVYLNMDQVVSSSLKTAGNFICVHQC